MLHARTQRHAGRLLLAFGLTAAEAGGANRVLDACRGRHAHSGILHLWYALEQNFGAPLLPEKRSRLSTLWTHSCTRSSSTSWALRLPLRQPRDVRWFSPRSRAAGRERSTLRRACMAWLWKAAIDSCPSGWIGGAAILYEHLGTELRALRSSCTTPVASATWSNTWSGNCMV